MKDEGGTAGAAAAAFIDDGGPSDDFFLAPDGVRVGGEGLGSAAGGPGTGEGVGGRGAGAAADGGLGDTTDERFADDAERELSLVGVRGADTGDKEADLTEVADARRECAPDGGGGGDSAAGEGGLPGGAGESLS